jgi:positive phototaxis protein PixI
MIAKNVDERPLPIKSSLTAENSELQQFLKFDFAAHCTALIPIEQVVEVLDLPLDRVVPFPHLPPAVMGAYNWRGEILWIVDLALLLGQQTTTPKLARRSRQPTIAIAKDRANTVDRHLLGLAVDRITDMEWCQPQPVDRLLDLQEQLTKFVAGYCSQSAAQRLLVLDPEAIFERSDLHSYI